MDTDCEQEIVVSKSGTNAPGVKPCLVLIVSVSCLAVGCLSGLTIASLLTASPDGASSPNAPIHDHTLGNFLSPSVLWDVNSSTLSTDEKVAIAEAETLCAEKRCCRQDDHHMVLQSLQHQPHPSSTDAPDVECSQLAYLDCLSLSNACVWDCHTPARAAAAAQPDSQLIFDHRLRGISSHDAPDFGVPRTFVSDQRNHSRVSWDEQLAYVSMDECGTIYEHHLTPSSLAREHATLRALDILETAPVFGSYSGANGLSEFEFVRRRMGAVLGSDSRSDVTSEQFPYTGNVYIQHRTNIPDQVARCSGAFISSRHILTAAHCLSDGAGNFYWDFVGVVNYNAGRHQVLLGWDEVFVPTQWHWQADWDYDYAVIAVKEELDVQVFGVFPFAWSEYIDEKWKFDVNGYPNDKGFTMQKQDVYMDMAVYYDTLYTQTGDIMDGNSGGPAWFTDDYTIYGIASHTVTIHQMEGVPIDPPLDIANGFTRITKPKFDLICAFMQKIPGVYQSCLQYGL